jgi:putative tryptophan/tyrosine transport system substrate-binding protein
MRRRAFIGLVGGAAIGWSHGVRAQPAPAPKKYRIAYLSVSTTFDNESRPLQALFEELRRLGYIEGTNLVVDRYSTEGSTERRAEIAHDAVRTGPDVIFVHTGPFTQVVADATATIPIVCTTADPIAFGLTTSLAQPSRNVTGFTVDAGAVETWGKRFQLLKEIAPTASRIGVLLRKKVWEGTETPAVLRAVRSTAATMGFDLFGVPEDSPINEATIRHAFEIIPRERIEALVVQDSAENLGHRQLIVDLVEKARIPAMYPYRDFADVGGLITYNSDQFDLYLNAARQIDQILKGTPIQRVPWYEPTLYQLIINLKAAKVLGLTVPPSLLARAEELIE